MSNSVRREACIAVGVVAVAQNTWGVGHCLLPAECPRRAYKVTLPVSHLQTCYCWWAWVLQSCWARTGHFYGAHTTSPSMFWGYLLGAAGHQAAQPELVSAVHPRQRITLVLLSFLCQKKTSGWQRSTATPSAVNRKNESVFSYWE